MNNSLHTVLGASGGVGQSVIKVLKEKEIPARAVSRSKKMEGVESVSADVLKKDDVDRVVAGSSVVYLCVGLEYKTEVWQRDWPVLMDNVIEACSKHNAVLIFLDNVHMYGPAPLQGHFDEGYTEEPTTEKGKVRKEIDDKLKAAFLHGKLKGVIARAADFIGPNAKNSGFYFSFLERMLKGKAPQSVLPRGPKHTYANTIDLGRALVELALEPETYNTVWHLPVGDPVSVDEMMAVFNDAMGTSYKVSYIPKFVRKLIAAFVPVVKEFDEMLYQFEYDYIMSFEKFKKQFPDFKITPYKEAVKQMVDSFQ
ncbi:NAD-dependent epimerase/dehydratase family protein [Carboxylicivirga linearis]|uniref:NAD-dependent epimerase/dehydratase family protein n=1 Tax=Carboxylicivirga linearis TaxID=1628157 RepID=A0ABS5JVX5_9BACT|nr:NAD-dependent epimerase/dehydratase family protein [Carboxylicivirga linearis]MBS2099055.1 NAD-dependent epimerase/dehydratase family protein [Carboxylicivirga linearis]